MALYHDNVSDEPLDVIRANECEQHPTLKVARFRRLFNEIEMLRAGLKMAVGDSVTFPDDARSVTKPHKGRIQKWWAILYFASPQARG